MATGKELKGIVELSDEEWLDLFNRQAQRYLKMSGADFLRAWREGEFGGREDESAVAHVLKLLPPDESSERGRK